MTKEDFDLVSELIRDEHYNIVDLILRTSTAPFVSLFDILVKKEILTEEEANLVFDTERIDKILKEVKEKTK